MHTLCIFPSSTHPPHSLSKYLLRLLFLHEAVPGTLGNTRMKWTADAAHQEFTEQYIRSVCMRVRHRKQLCMEQLMYSTGNCENSVLLGCSLDLRYCVSCLTSHLLVASSKKNKTYLKDLIYVCAQHLIFSLKLLSICWIPQLPDAPSLSDDLNSHPAEKMDSISWKPTDFLPLASSGPRIPTHSTPSHPQNCVSLCSESTRL